MNLTIKEKDKQLESTYNAIIHEINCRPQPSNKTMLILDGKAIEASDNSEIIINGHTMIIDGKTIDLRNISKINSSTEVKPVF